jgi:hypothetical protein
LAVLSLKDERVFGVEELALEFETALDSVVLEVNPGNGLGGWSLEGLLFSTEIRGFYQSVLRHWKHLLVDDFLRRGHHIRTEQLTQIPESIFILVSTGKQFNRPMDHEL